MLSANTVWLEPNDSVAPMSNVNFRKAMAYALNPTAIAQTVYGGIAEAANPTGLLPGLSSFVNQGVVSADAPTYNTGQGQAVPGRIRLPRARPSPCRCRTAGRTGWTPPPSSRTNSRRSASTSRSSTRRPTPAPRTWTTATTTCSSTTTPALDSTPWSYYQRVYALPIAKDQDSQLNWERINSPADWSLVQQAATVPLTDTAKLDSHLHPAGDRLLRPGAGDPALVQRRLVPGQHLGLVGLPGEHRFRPEHAGHVGRLPRRDDHGLRAGRPRGRRRRPRADARGPPSD